MVLTRFQVKNFDRFGVDILLNLWGDVRRYYKQTQIFLCLHVNDKIVKFEILINLNQIVVACCTIIHVPIILLLFLTNNLNYFSIQGFKIYTSWWKICVKYSVIVY